MGVLPESLCEKIELPLGTNVKNIFDIMAENATDYFDGLFLSEPSRTAVVESLLEKNSYSLFILQQVAHKQEKYCVISSNDGALPTLVGLLGASTPNSLPTDFENLIFWAIIDPSHTGSFTAEMSTQGNLTIKWRERLTGSAIVAIPTGGHINTQMLMVSAMFGLSCNDLSLPAALPPLLSNETRIQLASNIDYYTSTRARLLFEASTISHPKWRCLSLYRILENAYLSHVKQALLDSFDLDASKAVDDAKNNLASELNQLVNLTERIDLKTEFLDFNSEVECLISEGNRFIIKLDLGAQKEAYYKDKNLYKKAVLRFYKLRCAIAHAGTSSVIYEQFPDANFAATRLLPSIEKVALKSLSIAT